MRLFKNNNTRPVRDRTLQAFAISNGTRRRASAISNGAKIIFSTLLFLILFVLPLSASAITLNVDYPAIPYPGGTFDLDCLKIGSCELTVGSLFLFVYIAAIWVGGIIAAIALIQVGFSFIVSGDNAGIRERAKERFKNVLIGLIILLTATILLNIINPDITNLRKSSLFATDQGDFDCVIGTDASCEVPEKGTFNYRCTVGFVPDPDKCPSSLSGSTCTDVKFQPCISEEFGFTGTEGTGGGGGGIDACVVVITDPYTSCSEATTKDCTGKCTGDTVLTDPDLEPGWEPGEYYFCDKLTSSDTWLGGACSDLGGSVEDPSFIPTLTSACTTPADMEAAGTCPADTYTVSDNGSSQVTCQTNSNLRCGTSGTDSFFEVCANYSGARPPTEPSSCGADCWEYVCILK